MDEQFNENPRPQNPRRRRRTQEEIIKENYLPIIIAGVSLLLILIFVIGAIVRGISYSNAEKASLEAAYQSSVAESQAHAAEAEQLISQVSTMMANYDYDGAMEALNGFSGDIAQYNQLTALYTQCKSASASAVVWDDPNDVINLSFHQLIADPKRAFNDNGMGKTYNRDYVTVEEFQRILQQLFENGYVLVSLDDIVDVTTDASGNTTYTAKALKLPQGKKPLMITQTNVNSYYKQVDGDGDFLPDASGDGFASKLVIGEDGYPTCEYRDKNGNVTYGDYDLVPILERFIQEHPDFSYRGARAILGVTGYEGVLGYRTKPSYAETIGEERFNEEVEQAKAVAQCLKDHGWILASHSYGHPAYGNLSAGGVKTDSDKWEETCEYIIGETDIILYPHGSDIAGVKSYTQDNAKFVALYEDGYRYFFNVDSHQAWCQLGKTYFRGGRRNLDGYRMYHDPDKIADLIDANTVLDPNRPLPVPNL